MQIVGMPPEEIAKMRETAQPIIDAAIDAFGRPLHDQIMVELG